jgi:hypothetical protein
MARYRAKGMIYIDRLFTAGEEFSSDLVPGRNWEPLDDEAKAKVSALKLTPEPPSIIPAPKPMSAIPDDWRDLSPKKQIALAHKLGAPAKGTTVQIAVDWIEREIAQRGHVTDARVREAA